MPHANVSSRSPVASTFSSSLSNAGPSRSAQSVRSFFLVLTPSFARCAVPSRIRVAAAGHSCAWPPHRPKRFHCPKGVSVLTKSFPHKSLLNGRKQSSRDRAHAAKMRLPTKRNVSQSNSVPRFTSTTSALELLPQNTKKGTLQVAVFS